MYNCRCFYQISAKRQLKLIRNRHCKICFKPKECTDLNQHGDEAPWVKILCQTCKDDGVSINTLLCSDKRHENLPFVTFVELSIACHEDMITSCRTRCAIRRALIAFPFKPGEEGNATIKDVEPEFKRTEYSAQEEKVISAVTDTSNPYETSHDPITVELNNNEVSNQCALVTSVQSESCSLTDGSILKLKVHETIQDNNEFIRTWEMMTKHAVLEVRTTTRRSW